MISLCIVCNVPFYIPIQYNQTQNSPIYRLNITLCEHFTMKAIQFKDEPPKV